MLLRFVTSCALHVVACARILDGLDLAVNRKRGFSVIRSQTATSAQADDCFEEDQPTGSGVELRPSTIWPSLVLPTNDGHLARRFRRLEW